MIGALKMNSIEFLTLKSQARGERQRFLLSRLIEGEAVRLEDYIPGGPWSTAQFYSFQNLFARVNAKTAFKVSEKPLGPRGGLRCVLERADV